MSRFDEAIVVNLSAHAAYDRWSRLESLPLFLEDVDRIERTGGSSYRWATGVGGVRREWIAEITQKIPDQRIAWTTKAGDVVHQGAVEFTALDDDRCEIRVRMVIHPQTFFESVADTFGLIRRRIQRDLERFKETAEARPVATGPL